MLISLCFSVPSVPPWFLSATFYFDVLENNYFFYWRIKMNH